MSSLAAIRQVIAAEKSVVIRRHRDTDDADVGKLTIGRVISKRNVSHRCIVHEFFDAKTDAFLLSCIAKEEGRGWFGSGSGGAGTGAGCGGVIFTTLRDLDQREYEDVSTSPFCASYLGTLTPQGWGGQTWSLFTADEATAATSVKSSSAPVPAVPHCTIRYTPPPPPPLPKILFEKNQKPVLSNTLITPRLNKGSILR